MCERGALVSRLERLTAGSGGALGGNGDVSGMIRLAGGIEQGITGWLGVAMSSVGWCDGVVTAVGATGDGERGVTSGAEAGPAGVVGAMSTVFQLGWEKGRVQKKLGTI